MKSDVSLKLKSIYNLCDAFVRHKLIVGATLNCTVVLVAASVYSGKIPADVVLGNDQAGFLPLWPNLWSNQKVFTFTTMLLMYRQNRGKVYDTRHLRTVKVETEQ